MADSERKAKAGCCDRWVLRAEAAMEGAAAPAVGPLCHIRRVRTLTGCSMGVLFRYVFSKGHSGPAGTPGEGEEATAWPDQSIMM